MLHVGYRELPSEDLIKSMDNYPNLQHNAFKQILQTLRNHHGNDLREIIFTVICVELNVKTVHLTFQTDINPKCSIQSSALSMASRVRH